MKKIKFKVTHDQCNALLEMVQSYRQPSRLPLADRLIIAVSCEIEVLLIQKLLFVYEGKKTITLSVAQSIIMRSVLSNALQGINAYSIAVATPILEHLDKNQ